MNEAQDLYDMSCVLITGEVIGVLINGCILKSKIVHHNQALKNNMD